MPRLDRTVLFSATMVVLMGAVPLVIYWASVGRVKTVDARQALAMLTDPGADTMLVDVRGADEYGAGHIEGAENWPTNDILSLTSVDGIPELFKGKRLLLICESGITSARAVGKLSQWPGIDAVNVEGGMQAWIAEAANVNWVRPNPDQFTSLRIASGQVVPLPFRALTVAEQMTAFAGGYLIKPVYMLLALGLMLMLWRRRALDLALLGWSMAFFFIGETICWFNLPILRAESAFLEYWHSYGMVLCLALLILALIHGLDERILRFSDPKAKCALVGLCAGCAKFKPQATGLNRLLRAITLVLIAVSLMLLSINPEAISYNTQIFGFSVNYVHPVANQLYEIRFSPIAAVVLLLGAFVGLSFEAYRQAWWPKILLSGGLAFLAFGFMRSALFTFYRDNLIWFAFWEEATELVLVASIAFVLWVFRGGLGLTPPLDRWQEGLRAWLS